ncbi:SoxR reducing system RseC family protein [Kineobactrum salinum]|uniref:SoxR reducing system RseC family protein n=1 Tax=Kineobactrum salinum TaxID=2708301 RepID=A0A6C0U4W0_9GAMM|nr:SoxR reducing system RseC family protein [Kineobactrum salinum]QIB64484.1 SoxR reducing system RseC family protein [Kineobactrum salinum]
MISETGRVVAIERDALWVETIRSSTCGSCAARKGCGHGLLNRIRDGQRGLVRVLPGEYSPASCRVNDQVRIGIPEEVILRGSLVVYMTPLLAMLAAAALGASVWPSAADAAAMAGAVTGLLAGLLAVRLHACYHRRDPGLQPVLVGLMSSDAMERATPP